MCGRTSLFLPQHELEDRFDARIAADADGTARPGLSWVGDGGYEPRYNVAPQDPVEVVTAEAGNAIQRFHWGLAPTWADDPAEGFINARAETAAEKPAFREAWERRPCLVPSTGFYEWQETGRTKRPYRVHRDGDAFAMAGLWERWEGPDRAVPTVTVLTTEPNDLMRPLHDRMPVVLARDEERRWLDAPPDERRALCEPREWADFDADPVSTRVNDPANDDPGVIEPPDHEQSGLGRFG